MMSNERATHIAARLRDEGKDTIAFFRALAPEQWAQQVYTTGPEWDVRQVLCHFVSAERGFSTIFNEAMSQTQSPPEDFDIDRFNAGEVGLMDGIEPEDLIAAFQQARSATIAFVESIDDDDLEREAWHPWFKWDKLDKFLKLAYRHNLIHQRDIQKALDTGQPVPPSD